MQETKNPHLYLIDDINNDIRTLVQGKEFIGVTVHHSDYNTSEEKEQAILIDGWHITRFGPLGIGYAFVVEKTGSIYAGHRIVKGLQQAHCLGNVTLGSTKRLINQVYIGICFSGQGTSQEMSMGQRTSGYSLIHHLAKYSSIEIHGIHTHAVLQGNKTCPGYLFEKWIPHFHYAMEEGVRMR